MSLTEEKKRELELREHLRIEKSVQTLTSVNGLLKGIVEQLGRTPASDLGGVDDYIAIINAHENLKKRREELYNSLPPDHQKYC
jgi:hypothetical protein